jgi:hypothetical protein
MVVSIKNETTRNIWWLCCNSGIHYSSSSDLLPGKRRDGRWAGNSLGRQLPEHKLSYKTLRREYDNLWSEAEQQFFHQR